MNTFFHSEKLSFSFPQRYFVNETYYKPGGPVFLMIGGEGPANPAWMQYGTWLTYAKKVGALCLMLEHRFYGKSHPTMYVWPCWLNSWLCMGGVTPSHSKSFYICLFKLSSFYVFGLSGKAGDNNTFRKVAFKTTDRCRLPYPGSLIRHAVVLSPTVQWTNSFPVGIEEVSLYSMTLPKAFTITLNMCSQQV